MIEPTDEELYEYLKTLPEFANLPLPKTWYDKYNIKVPNPPNYREFVESAYAIKCAFAPKDLPPLTLKTPDNYPFKEIVKDEVPLEVVSKELTLPEPEDIKFKVVEPLPIVIE